MNYDLKIIKKKYGEKMSHLCRELFPTILEEEGLLSSLLLNNFYESHFLYDDIVNNDIDEEFKTYIYNLTKIEEKEMETIETPEVLLEKVGYELFECKSEEDIQNFKKYYKKEEELCTFKGDRLKSCYVYFAVKKDVDKIKREDFIIPNRQDLYGTSVISIQFSRGRHKYLSIKNRYNHTVINPDATFSNNLDNIIPGLSASFAKHYGMIQKHKSSDFEIPEYVRAADGRFYKFNYEINNIYYCPENIIINEKREVIKLDKSRYLLIDYFLVDLKDKKVMLHDKKIDDCFIECFKNIDNICITKIKDNKCIEFTNKDNGKINVEIDKYNRLIKLDSDIIEEVGSNFLYKNEEIEELNLPNLKAVGNKFLYVNLKLTNLYLPNLIEVGSDFLERNCIISTFIAPNLKIVGDYFLANNNKLSSLDLPNLEIVYNYFLRFNNNLLTLSVPSLISVGNCFLEDNLKLTKINAPNLIEVGEDFLSCNQEMRKLTLEKLSIIGDYFLKNNCNLEELHLDSVKQIGSNFLFDNKNLEELNLPKLISIKHFFLYNNKTLKTFIAPNLEKVGINFLWSNQKLSTFKVPNIEEIGDGFLTKLPNRTRIIIDISIRKNINKANAKIKKLIRSKNK